MDILVNVGVVIGFVAISYGIMKLICLVRGITFKEYVDECDKLK